ncbi:aldolase [Labrys sp. KNU-23]|uniref:HpcH/HpaI aldolase family protein n=1 Tax=Labrys sp. KNU-23 TaxID=2789216 RepID=UPI0011ED0B28|nr:aldolase/citrate lyase family protein [Labrys sp. KNU-23]QEN89682.1 aldolase [Labrys sp. KNU-23]
MHDNAPAHPADAFRQRLLSRKPLLGSFIKTPTVHATEILGDLGFDFVVVDEEHAPFDRGQTELIMLAARAAGTAAIVRVPEIARILGALDDGAAGVLVPHISSAARARETAAACRYRGGRRGFSNSPRAGRYGGLGIWPHVDRQDAHVSLIAMIEDPEALAEIDAILATEGLDAVFIGRGDLTVALQAESPEAPPVQAAVETICAAAERAGKPVCMMVANAAEAKRYHTIGASAFIVASDQAFMRRAAAESLGSFAKEFAA